MKPSGQIGRMFGQSFDVINITTAKSTITKNEQRTDELSTQGRHNFCTLNRACWNGLYRENLQGKFNVPIGTKSKILFESDNFSTVSEYLKDVILSCNDFEQTIDKATINDLVFVDPPYTTAHNFNGFVKYNQTIFSWDDQIRLRNSIARAADRGAKIIVTNAMHQSVVDLYEGISTIVEVPRQTIISGSSKGRKHTAESLIYVGNN